MSWDVENTIWKVDKVLKPYAEKHGCRLVLGLKDTELRLLETGNARIRIYEADQNDIVHLSVMKENGFDLDVPLEKLETTLEKIRTRKI